MSIRHIPLLLASVIVLPLLSRGQSPYYFKHYEVEHGLSNNTVLCSMQDKEGFMWFGTIDGLNRFDGYRFQTFRNDPAAPKSIGNNSVNCLLTTKDEKILAGTAKGLYLYDPVYQNFELVPGTANQPIKALCRDDATNVWLIINDTLSRYNEETKNIRRFRLGNGHATSICKDHGGELWIATSTGMLNRFDPVSQAFKPFDLFSRTPHISGRHIVKIFDTKKGALFVGTLNQGIKLFDIATGEYKDIPLYNDDKTEIFARDFLQYSENEFWVATEYGIFIYDIGCGKFSSLLKQYNNIYTISDNAVNTLSRDREGGVWAGTRFGGVSYYPYPYTPFQKYFTQNGTNSIMGNGVHEIRPDQQGNLWIGTEDGGLNKLNTQTKIFEHFRPDGRKGSISYSNIHGLLIEGNELWIGTYQCGLDRMDLKTGKVFKHYSAGPGSFSSNFIVHLYKTATGEILVGTWDGLFRYNRTKDNFSLVPGFNFQTQSAMEDGNGLLWICTLGNGVFTLDQKTGAIRNYRHKAGNPDSLCNNMVNGQFLDSRGNVWFATEGGLSKYDRNTKKFRTYTIRHGLPSNFLFKILEDERKNLWISSTKGLIRFNPDTETIKVFTTADGLLNDQFNWNSAYKDPTGRMYFGSVKGMISFVPEKFTTNNIAPPVYITGIQLHNTELTIGEKGSPLQKSVTYTKRITLKHYQSTISIDFAALSYTSPQTNEYAYRMEGLNNEWTTLSTYRKAYFTELPPGLYTFRVKASNSSGIWNEKETALQIEVLPAFWKSRLAYILYALLTGSVIFFLVRAYHFRFREKNRRRMELLEHKKEKELYQNKIEFFTAVAHEIRTPLTLIQGPMENIMDYVDEVPEIKDNLKIMERNTHRLIDISNQLLDFRRIESRGFSLRFENINITALLRDIHTNFQPLALQHNLSAYSLHLPAKDLHAYADPDSLEKIVGNLYSNAIKYSNSIVHTRLYASEAGNQFYIEVKNDGLLIPQEAKERIFEPFFRIQETSYQNGTGIGLAISRLLAELHKGSLELKDTDGRFNTFVLKLPININQEPDMNALSFEYEEDNI